MKIFKEKYLSRIIVIFPISLISINLLFLIIYFQILSDDPHNMEEHISNIVIFTTVLFLFTIYISWLVSKKVARVFKKYRRNVSEKHNALQNINAVLEKKVKKKTAQLAKLNEELHQMVEIEVEKNREKDKVLFQQSKMASMGEMINNIAHQWRQPLSTISTASSGLSIKVEMDMIEKDEFKKSLDQIVETTQQLSQTIEDFRNFFLENKEIEKFVLNETIKKNLSLSSSSLKVHHIEVHEDYANIEYEGVKNELIQAILNIINNAKDALVENTDKEFSRKIFLKTDKDDEFAYIWIYDNAGGISDEVMPKIFEPYFTTKHQSHGTGIGLYMTREIIVNHMNGDLLVENYEFDFEEEKYKGAMFTIKLPLNNDMESK